MRDQWSLSTSCCARKYDNGYDMVGMHIHDAYGMDDHMPPFYGGPCLEDILPIIEASPIKVLEISHKYSLTEISQGLDKLLTFEHMLDN